MTDCGGWIGRVTVYGPAQAQGSKRAFVRGGKAILADASPRARPWRQEVAALMLAQAPPAPIGDAVAVLVRIYVRRPRSHYRVNGEVKPDAPLIPPAGLDVDKICRAILDAGTGIFWVDDARVADLRVQRFYADQRPEGVLIEAWALEDVAARRAEAKRRKATVTT